MSPFKTINNQKNCLPINFKGFFLYISVGAAGHPPTRWLAKELPEVFQDGHIPGTTDGAEWSSNGIAPPACDISENNMPYKSTTINKKTHQTQKSTGKKQRMANKAPERIFFLFSLPTFVFSVVFFVRRTLCSPAWGGPAPWHFPRSAPKSWASAWEFSSQKLFVLNVSSCLPNFLRNQNGYM